MLVSCSEVCQEGSEGYSEDYEARAWGDDLKPGEAGLVFTSAIHCLDDHMISYGSLMFIMVPRLGVDMC